MHIKKNIKKIIHTTSKVYNYFNRVKTIMPQGEELCIDLKPLQNIDSGYGDWLIHPCIRYIPNGFAGHKWWMVSTPYPNYNSYYENPILFYADDETTDFPIHWHFVAIVEKSHNKGYNADCNLYFDGEALWIIWKEAGTDNTNIEHGNKAILGKKYNGTSFTSAFMICENIDDTNMYLASPTLINISGHLKLFAVFTPNSYLSIPNRMKGPRHLAVFDIINIKENIKCSFKGVFKQTYPEKFDFWHIDIFSFKDKYYCLVTPESANQILLGESCDGLHFKFYSTPLLHYNGKEKTEYTYKVSAVIINDIIYVVYPMKLKEQNIVRLHMTKMNFNVLLNNIKEENEKRINDCKS